MFQAKKRKVLFLNIQLSTLHLDNNGSLQAYRKIQLSITKYFTYYKNK